MATDVLSMSELGRRIEDEIEYPCGRTIEALNRQISEEETIAWSAKAHNLLAPYLEELRDAYAITMELINSLTWLLSRDQDNSSTPSDPYEMSRLIQANIYLLRGLADQNSVANQVYSDAAAMLNELFEQSELDELDARGWRK